LILIVVLVVNKKYLQSLEDTRENQYLKCVKYPKGTKVVMVRKTIHITEAQAQWLDDNSYNVSRYIRKIFTLIMTDKDKAEMFNSKIKTKPELDLLEDN
tara:strand:- start:207 stop:503 length:297 start_codon:yes stop_codon:yes gene_type:complete